MVNLSYEAQVAVVIGLCLISSYIFNILLKKIKVPSLIAPLLIGAALNLGLINKLSFLPNFSGILETFANFGIIIMLFFIGLGVDFHYFKDLSRNSTIMALNAGHIPFFLGFIATLIFKGNFIQALFVGFALAITAEEVTVAVLDELKLLSKRVGQLIIEAGIIGDIFEIIAIALLGIIIKSQNSAGSYAILSILLEFFAFILVILVMRYFIIDQLMKIPKKRGRKYEYFTVAFIVLMIMTVCSELLNFSHVIGALIAGILLKDKLIQDKLYYEEHHIIESLEVFNFGVFHPLIFIWIGLSLDMNMLSNNLIFGIVLTVLALSGKIIGSVIGNHFCHEPWKEGILIGWGLNARGATELFALIIARNQGIITQDIFSAVVFMAFMTTIISPIIFEFLVLKGYGVVKYRRHGSRHHHSHINPVEIAQK